jgi:MraZ protein
VRYPIDNASSLAYHSRWKKVESSGATAALRGNSPAKIDDKGRLKVPTGFRSVIESEYGRMLYVTSLDGESVLLYPLPVWEGIERRLAEMPATNPARRKFFARTSYFGQVAELDGQGRVLIHPRLRESAQTTGEVDVLGHHTHLEVWNHERLKSEIARDRMTSEEFQALSDFGI